MNALSQTIAILHGPGNACRRSDRGFSLPELVANLAIIFVLAAITVPAVSKTVKNYQLMGDARRIASQVTVARMRAAANFTQGEVSFNLTARTFQRELYDKSTSAFTPEGGTQNLSQDITFGYGTLSTPAGTQASIAQSTAIKFNSRGIPVDNTGTPTGSYAIYLTNGLGLYYAVTVTVSSIVQIWQYDGSAWVRSI